MSFLLLVLLIAGIIVGVVLLRRANRKERSLKKRSPSVKSMECIGKVEEPQGKVKKPTADDECEHCIDDVRVDQYVEKLNHESTDVLRKRSLNSVDGSRVRYNGDYDEIDAVEILPKNNYWDRHSTVENDQQDEKPSSTPDSVYAVVDKSKKKKKGKTEGDQSTTATQDLYTEEQHYESSTVIGIDWVGNKVNPNEGPGDTKKGSLSGDPKVTGPQSELCDPNAVYAVVDKSKKTKKRIETK